MDRAPEIKGGSAALIQLVAPATGADFTSKLDKPSEPAPVDVSATTAEPQSLPAAEGLDQCTVPRRKAAAPTKQLPQVQPSTQYS